MPTYYPQLNDKGQPVRLAKRSMSTPLSSWAHSGAVATAIRGRTVPEELNGITLAEWKDVPSTEHAWNDVEGQLKFDEPPFNPAKGKMLPASSLFSYC